MEEECLLDIRALMLSARAREIRDNVQIAKTRADIEVVTIHGVEQEVLTFEAALRYAIKELGEAQQLIEKHTGF
ncbi:MAG TPA: hypothetical protein DEA38_02455 [Stenotrophomonas sp.]|nr:hypothetical protein [Stenotrophomonas sp.]